MVAIAAWAWLAACGDTPDPAPLPPASSGCGERAYLQTEFYGEISGPIDWPADALDCEGMPRPEGAGARLRFAGQAGDLSLAVIVAIPDLEPGTPARELGTNVTVIEEGSGRFFSTAGLGSCWTDVLEQREPDDDTSIYFVAGRLYCITPLAEVNGDSSVTLRDLQYGGYVDWGAK